MFARLTRGKLPGNLKGKPVTVAVVGDEDDFDEMWTPRLYAAKADLDRVRILEPPSDGYITLGTDRQRIEEAIEECGAKILYLDSLVDNLGVAVNDFHPKQLRDALQPAKRLAKDLGIAVIGTLHTNKSGDNTRQITQGAHAYNAISRSSMFLFDDPDEGGRTVLVRGKGNPPGCRARLPLRLSPSSSRITSGSTTFPRQWSLGTAESYPPTTSSPQ